uniref:Xylem serine proteinase 1 n=1 Tax=Solanum tuberosum TaxID=4113 RepID=M1C8M6_SOLTU
MAPLAHIAMYKVCSSIGYPETDILAAIYAAIEDGVDVLSISIGTKSNQFWMSDVIAEGALLLMQKGILVTSSAGNTGPLPGTVNNRDPWLLTVGASTTDRKLRVTVRLGDGKEIYGESGFQPKDFSETMLPLIRNVSDAFCSAESLENIDVKGKIVLCVSDGNISRIGKGHYVKNAGGAGMILVNDELHGFTLCRTTCCSSSTCQLYRWTKDYIVHEFCGVHPHLPNLTMSKGWQIWKILDILHSGGARLFIKGVQIF